MIDDAAVVRLHLHLVVPGGHHDEVHARRADLLFDRRLGAAADGNHRQDGADANRHAEHGEGRAQPVPAERLERDVEAGLRVIRL